MFSSVYLPTLITSSAIHLCCIHYAKKCHLIPLLPSELWMICFSLPANDQGNQTALMSNVLVIGYPGKIKVVGSLITLETNPEREVFNQYYKNLSTLHITIIP